MRKLGVAILLAVINLNSAQAANVKARLEPSNSPFSGPDLVVGGNRYDHRLLGYDSTAIEAFSQNPAAYREMVAYSHDVTTSWISFGATAGLFVAMPYIVGMLDKSQREFGRGAMTAVGVGGFTYSCYLATQSYSHLLRGINIYNGVYDERSGLNQPKSDYPRIAWSVLPQLDVDSRTTQWRFPVSVAMVF